MKTSVSLLALMAFTGTTAFAQLNPLPPPSLVDGIPVQSEGVNGGVTHWDNPSTLGGYKVVSTSSGDAPITSPTYNPAGLTFASTIPSVVTSIMNAINTNAGVVRTIFVGESAGWQNDLGYTYSGNPQGPGSFTTFPNIQVNPTPATVAFGDFFDVPLAIGRASTFDLWLNGVGDFGTTNPTPPTQNGGVYTAFHPSNSAPFIGAGNVMWAQSPLMVSTFVPALGGYQDVATYLLTFEDWRLDRGSDRDYSDAVVALQFFNSAGIPFGPTPVPEPSTYGLFAAIGAIGLIALRRFKTKQSQA